MTLDDYWPVYSASLKLDAPTTQQAQYMASWTCAMGSALCDIGHLDPSF